MVRYAQLAFQLLNVAMVLLSALMVWKAIMWYTQSDSPLVVVLRCVGGRGGSVADAGKALAVGAITVRACSGSMEPAMIKGDVLVLNNAFTPVEVGEIVVFRIHTQEIPIVHRILENRFLYVILGGD